jgi:hypothetical protein
MSVEVQIKALNTTCFTIFPAPIYSVQKSWLFAVRSVVTYQQAPLSNFVTRTGTVSWYTYFFSCASLRSHHYSWNFVGIVLKRFLSDTFRWASNSSVSEELLILAHNSDLVSHYRSSDRGYHCRISCSSKSDMSPRFFRAMVIDEKACWRYRHWCGVKNIFGISVYSKEFSFPILLVVLHALACTK